MGVRHKLVFVFLFLSPIFMGCQRGASPISMTGDSRANGTSSSVIDDSLFGGKDGGAKFGGNVDPENYGGQTNPSANKQTSDSEQASSVVDGSKEGLQRFLDDLRTKLSGLDQEIFDALYENPAGAGMNYWYCAYHDRRFGPLSGSFGIMDVDPNYPGGYKLSMRPGLRHCTGIGMRVIVVGAFHGRAVELQCNDSGTGSCSQGLFHVPIKSRPTWNISQQQLAPLLKRQPVAVFYDWDHNTVGPCSGPTQSSYNIAILLQRQGFTPPAQVPCPDF